MTTNPFGDKCVCHAGVTTKALHWVKDRHSILKANQLTAQKNAICAVLCAYSHLHVKFGTQGHRGRIIHETSIVSKDSTEWKTSQLGIAYVYLCDWVT